MTRGLSPDEVLALPVLVSITVTAGALGISRQSIYAQVREDSFPIEALRFGKMVRFRRSDILELVGLEDTPRATALAKAG